MDRFTVNDVLDLDLDAEMVVLSACETAEGPVRAGDGVGSLASAFLFAGADGVIASLWPVSDRAAAKTMDALYERFLNSNEHPSVALRQARNTVRKLSFDGAMRGVGSVRAARDRAEPHAGHPYYWAPFIHVGAPPRDR